MDIGHEALVLTLLIFFLIDAFPTIMVHLDYFIQNRRSLLELNTERRELTYSSPKKKLQYSFDDIMELHYFRSYGKNTGWYSFGEYRFYKIVFNDQNKIIVTCLMINNIENTLESLLQINARKHFKIVCFL
jgi:hypothetical protein